jgi:pimeloyl-ACP methyl ester carboxylesterase
MGSVLTKNGVKVWPTYNNKDRNHYQKSLTPVAEYDGVEAHSSLATYKLLLADLKLKGYEVKDRVYDWRKNNLYHLEELRQDIANAKTDEVVIIAHSMGGIIAKLALNKYAEDDAIKKVKKLITVGTPWKGSMSAIRFLKYGAKVPDMSLVTLIDAKSSFEISSYFPSIYQLLPTQSYLDYLKENQILPCNFNGDYHYEALDFFKLLFQKGFAVNHKYTDVFDEYYYLLNQELSTRIEHHELISVGVPTITVISEKSNKEPYALWDDGDGTVPVLSAYSNSNSANYHSYFFRKKKHNFFATYPRVISHINDILRNRVPEEETEDLFFSLNSNKYKKFNGYIQKVACPVEVSISNKDGQIIYGNVETISEEEIREIIQTETTVNSLGTTTYIVFDEESNTSMGNFGELIIEAYDKGPTSVSIDKYENGKLIERNAFNTFEINPKLKAIINLNSTDVKKSTLDMYENGEIVKEGINLEEIEFNEEKLKLPETFLDIKADKIIKNENDFYVKEEVQISINKINQGSFSFRETYVIINNDKIHTIKEEQKLTLDINNLKEGRNIIEYYSVDEFDNTEKRKSIVIYFISRSYEKVQLYFDYRHYFITIKENPQYLRILDQLKKGNIPSKLIFDDEDGVTGYDVVYRNKKRTLKIELTDIFNDIETHDLIIDENIIKKIIRGTADTKNVEQLVSDLKNIDQKYKFHMTNTGNRGNHSSLKKENLDGCVALEIFSKNIDVKISKNVEYDVKYSELTEEIEVKHGAKYNFTFKVNDVALDEYVEGLNLLSQFEFVINNEKYEDNFAVVYNSDRKTYSFVLDVTKAREFIDEFWKNKQKNIQEAKIEVINKFTKVSIRSLPVKIQIN